LRDALVASMHFDAFHRHAGRVVMANIAQTVNVLQAMILTDPDSGALVLTPTYHVFAMNRAHHDAYSLPTSILLPENPRIVEGRDLPSISASASTRENSALISLSNLDAKSQRTVVLDLRGRDISGHRATVLTAPDLRSHNSA